jgi:hypothetical protein
VKQLVLILAAVLFLQTGAVLADQTVATENMTDTELASYISGRLRAVLGNDFDVSQTCDADTGCDIVVQ